MIYLYHLISLHRLCFSRIRVNTMHAAASTDITVTQLEVRLHRLLINATVAANATMLSIAILDTSIIISLRSMIIKPKRYHQRAVTGQPVNLHRSSVLSIQCLSGPTRKLGHWVTYCMMPSWLQTRYEQGTVTYCRRRCSSVQNQQFITEKRLKVSSFKVSDFKV